MKRALPLVLVAAAVLGAYLMNCGGDGGLGGVSGVIDQATYALAAGETETVGGDLTITASELVQIDGGLLANGSYGQNITIVCDGDIVINGRVAAGNGEEGRDMAGGDLTLISNNGNIILGTGAGVSAGHGGAGKSLDQARSASEEDRDYALAGADGGSVIIRAPNGEVFIPDIPGIITIGNGGDGMDVVLAGDDLLAEGLPESFENQGGKSGGLDIQADRITGLVYTEERLTEDLTDPETGEVILAAGETAYILEPTEQIAGGRGGRAGAVYAGLDQEGVSTWPGEGGEESADCGCQAVGDDYEAKAAEVNTYRGQNGGHGFFSGGNGASVTAGGEPGVDGGGVTNDGTDGGKVLAIAGDGGPCGPRSHFPRWLAGDCTPGRGGDAFAVGGRGGHGANPSGKGGKGGSAYAESGTAGLRLYNQSVEVFPRGRSTAVGGQGGNGGGRCPDAVASQGGKGGDGGLAGAFALGWYLEDTIRIAGGDGGRGGDSLSNPGPGGAGGEANCPAYTFDLSCSYGADGERGRVCGATTTTTTTTTVATTTAPTTTQATTTTGGGGTCLATEASYSVVNGEWNTWADCGLESTIQLILCYLHFGVIGHPDCGAYYASATVQDGQTYGYIEDTGWGCKVTAHCSR